VPLQVTYRAKQFLIPERFISMSQEQAKQFIEEATQSLQNSQFDQALSLIDQAIALNEKDTEAHVLRGITLASLNQPQAAEEAFRKAILLAPYNAKAYYNLGVLKYSQGDKHEAMSMATEAVKIDGRHSGAKELITRIERETNPNVGVATGTPQPSIIDPLAPLAPNAPPPGTGMVGGPPPGTGVPTAPAATPPGGIIEPTKPSAAPPTRQEVPAGVPPGGSPPQGQYIRPGYEPQNAGGHAMPWVGNMGATWATIGWIIAVVGLGVFVVSLIMVLPAITLAMNNPQAARTAPQPGSPILTILGWGLNLAGLGWMIVDLVDRRGNMLWLLLGVPCCCLPWLTLPIYMLAGRKRI
jgi:hypothetical protein